MIADDEKEVAKEEAIHKDSEVMFEKNYEHWLQQNIYSYLSFYLIRYLELIADDEKEVATEEAIHEDNEVAEVEVNFENRLELELLLVLRLVILLGDIYSGGMHSTWNIIYLFLT